MIRLFLLRIVSVTTVCLLTATPGIRGQEVKQPAAVAETPAIPAEAPTISDEPKTIDPATLLPEYLATPVTVEFTETSLREVGKWVEDQRKIPVLFDAAALSGEGIPLGEPVTDKLANAPLYLLLNRLQSLGLAWYVEDRILHITTRVAADERLTTQPYNVADLLDAGYKLNDLGDTLMQATSGPWEEVDGTGGEMQWLGDVQFVRQTAHVHREIAGLLAALRKHGRQTFTLDPPQHALLRQKLEQNIDVSFRETTLVRAVADLAEKSGADIRLDMPSVRKAGVRDRQPVSLSLTDRKLSTVLDVLLNDLGLTWILRDGVLWIVSKEDSEELQKTAVYDVRDLCRDDSESTALSDAVMSQTAGPWEVIDGTGGTIAFPKSGTLVVRSTERSLREVLDLLETYRKALRASKRRDRNAVDPQEVVTRYYRMHAGIADDLVKLLPTLVAPESWKSAQNLQGAGTVLKINSEPELRNAYGHTIVADPGKVDKPQGDALLVARSVLIVRQTRANHDEIAKTIRLIEQGDPPSLEAGGMGGLGGQGGFGGSFFTVPARPTQR